MSLVVRKGASGGPAGPNGAGQDHLVLHDRGPGAQRWRRHPHRRPVGGQHADPPAFAPGPVLPAARGLDLRKLNVEDNVRAVLELQTDAAGRPLSRAEIEAQLTGLLQELRVEHLRQSPALALSGGERRRAKSPGRWPRSRASSCWTSPLPASIPLP